MSPNVEQVFLCAVNEGELYQRFVRYATQSREPERYYIGDYAAVCRNTWENAASSALHAFRRNAARPTFGLSRLEFMELAFCLAVHFADHVRELDA